MPEIFAAHADDGENDACRDLVRLVAELLAGKFVRGEIDTFIRPLNGGDVVKLSAEMWEIDDPLPRFATGALNRDDRADPDAEPTNRIFVDGGQFEHWLAALKPPGPLTVREVEANVDPTLRAARSVSHRQAPQPDPERREPSPTLAPGPDGLGPELLTLSEVEQMTTRKSSTIYKLESESQFPQRIKIGSSTRWKRTEVEAWLSEQIARGRS